jgi:NTE family protein
LAEQGIAPEIIAGCSMGAMVGAAFAAGRIEQLETWALSLDWKRVVGLLDIGLRGGLIKGDRLVNMFQGQFVECQFSELMLPFAAVATDLASGKELWLREGKVSDAVRASCTVPGLFQPVLLDGRYVVDGSVVNPIPVSLCRAMGAEIVIAVHLGSHMDRRFPLDPQERAKSERRWLFNVLGPTKRPEIPAPPSMVDTLLGAIDVMQERFAEARLLSEPPDVLLEPSLGQLGPFDYHRAEMAITGGRQAVAQMLPAIQEALSV